MAHHTLRCLLLLLVEVAACCGQATLSLSSGSAATNGNVALNLTLTSPPGGEPAGLQWALTYAASDIVSLTAAGGPSATGADKEIHCSGGPGSHLCLLAGLNSKVMSNGVVAALSVTLTPGTSTATIQVTQTLGVGISGAPINVNGVGGSIVRAGFSGAMLTSLTCTPATLRPNTSATCSVAVSNGKGTTVKLSSNLATLEVPTSVLVGAGGLTATFAAAAGSVLGKQTAALTAALNGTSQTAVISLMPQ